MKKVYLPFVAVLFALSCEEPATEIKPGGEPEPIPSRMLTSCQPSSGSDVYTKNGTYNCHQYVKAALVENGVNLSTGEPNNVNYSYLPSGTIQDDDNFIRVCDATYAGAIAHLPKSQDHSALRVGTIYGYTYPGTSRVWKSASALNYGTACDYEYFAAIPNLGISGPVKSGNTYTFTLVNKNQYPFIIADANRWVFDTSKFSASKTDTQLTLTPNSGVSGSFTVKAIINTTATNNPTGSCATGINNMETATTHKPERTVTFTVSPDCGGTLDGGPLYTVNSVSKYVQHQVVMNASNFTWVKTSGNATWSVSNNGKNMTFSISSGSVSFNAYGSGCNLNFTFYGY